jgi:hypothetical protein
MSKIKKFPKQPDEILDYDVSFEDYLNARNDIIDAHFVTADPGITVEYSIVNDKTVKVWLSGGEDGEEYAVCVTVDTRDGRQKQGDFILQVRELGAPSVQA